MRVDRKFFTFFRLDTQHSKFIVDRLNVNGSIMIAYLIATLAFMMLVAADFEAPWFYHGLDGPEFTQSMVDNNVETRKYGGNLWASTKVMTNSIEEADNIGFNRLFDYISGANAAKAAIDMTTPVLMKVTPGAGPNCNSTFIVSFYVPNKYQQSGPPAPTNPDVFIQTISPLSVAVNEFGGFATDKEEIAKAAALSQQVAASKAVKADPAAGDSWWKAGYDPPFRVTNRHNEVWVEVLPTD